VRPGSAPALRRWSGSIRGTGQWMTSQPGGVCQVPGRGLALAIAGVRRQAGGDTHGSAGAWLGAAMAASVIAPTSSDGRCRPMVFLTGYSLSTDMQRRQRAHTAMPGPRQAVPQVAVSWFLPRRMLDGSSGAPVSATTAPRSPGRSHLVASRWAPVRACRRSAFAKCPRAPTGDARMSWSVWRSALHGSRRGDA